MIILFNIGWLPITQDILLPGNFHVVEIDASSTAVIREHRVTQVEGVLVPPAPHNTEDWVGFE